MSNSVTEQQKPVDYIILGNHVNKQSGAWVPNGKPISSGSLPWSTLVQHVTDNQIAENKGHVRLFIPGALVEKPRENDKGQILTNENIKHLSFLAFDIEGGGTKGKPQKLVELEEIVGIAEYLSTRQFESWFFNSYSDGLFGKGRRGRIIVPITSPIDPSTYGQERVQQGRWWSENVFWALSEEILGPWYKHEGIKAGLEGAKLFCNKYYRRSSPPNLDPDCEPWINTVIGPHFDPHPFVEQANKNAAIAKIATAARKTLTGQGIDKKDLTRAANNWSRSKDIPTKTAGLALRRVLKGETEADEGSGFSILNNLCCQMVKEFKLFDPAVVAKEVFTGSCQIWSQRSGKSLEVELSYVEKQLQHWFEKDEQYAVKRIEERIAKKTADLASAGRENDYTPEEKAKLNAFGPWLLEREGETWVLVMQDDGQPKYLGPRSNERSAALFAAQKLIPSKLRCKETTKEGGSKVRSIKDMIADFGRSLDDVRGSMVAETTIYDKRTNTLTVAPTPLCRREPVFHEDIDLYLKIIGGKEYERLCDYISVYMDLNALLPALVLHGRKSGGKTFLAKCLASPWSKDNEPAPATLKNMLSDHPDGILRCPVVLADEHIPRDRQNKPRTEDLRELITKKEHEVNPKYGRKYSIYGYVRVVCTVNDLKLLAGEDAESKHAQEASIDRFFLLSFPDTSREFLEHLPHDRKTEWLNGSFAEHMFYLQQSRSVGAPTGRWRVQPTGGEQLAETLAFSTYRADNVCSWLLNFLENPGSLYAYSQTSDKSLPAFKTGFIEFGVRATPNSLRVRPKTLDECWSVYGRGTKPTYSSLMTTIRNLSEDPDRRQKLTLPDNNIVNVYEIDIDKLCNWGEQFGLTAEDFKEMLLKAVEKAKEAEEKIKTNKNSVFKSLS